MTSEFGGGRVNTQKADKRKGGCVRNSETVFNLIRPVDVVALVDIVVDVEVVPRTKTFTSHIINP